MPANGRWDLIRGLKVNLIQFIVLKSWTIEKIQTLQISNYVKQTA